MRDERVLWGACDPLPTPRPLGPIRDLARRGWRPRAASFSSRATQPYDIFAALHDDLCTAPSVLVLDDLHWADQGTIDLLRFVLRRISQTRSLVVGIIRDDEVGANHPHARAARRRRPISARRLAVHPAAQRAGRRNRWPASGPSIRQWLHSVTGGNAFFVCEMLDHHGDDLPTTVRDAVLARTSGLDPAAWDLLNLLTCSPGVIPDYLLADLGVTLPASRALVEAGLIRRSSRGVAFRHDLCRLAIRSVIPPGAEPRLHRRLIDAYEATGHVDPAVLTHHALGRQRHRAGSAATHATRASPRRARARTRRRRISSRIALERGGTLEPACRSGAPRTAGVGVLPHRPTRRRHRACHRAMRSRRALGESRGGQREPPLAFGLPVVQRPPRAVGRPCDTSHDGSRRDSRRRPRSWCSSATRFAMQAYLAVQASDLDGSKPSIARAREIAEAHRQFRPDDSGPADRELRRRAQR